MLDEAELGRVYDAHAGALFGYLLSLTRSEADTKDLLQTLFCRLAADMRLLRGVEDERAWLIRLAHNAAVDFFRRREVRRLEAEPRATEEWVGLFEPGRDPDEAAMRRGLEGALVGLPVEQRAVVYLRLWEGMTFLAIAGVLGIPANTAASRYRYGVDKMRERLRPLYDEMQ